MFRGVALALAMIAGEILIGRAAWADDRLAQARTAIEVSDYVAARSALAAVRDAGGCTPDETRAMYLLSGRVEAALGDSQAATEAFSRLLVLAPTAALPSGMSPKITGPFDAAVASLTLTRPFEIEVDTRTQPPVIALVMLSDPMHMAARVRVVYSVDGGGEETTEVAVVAARDRTEIPLRAGRIAARIAVLDEHGNELVVRGGDLPIAIAAMPPPAPVAPAAPPVRVRIAPRPLYLRWWPYAAAAVAFGGAAGYFGWQAYGAATDLRQLNRESTEHSWVEADRLRDRGTRDTLLANIGLVAAGACALTAGALAVIRPGRETRIAAAPLPGGGALAVGGRF